MIAAGAINLLDKSKEAEQRAMHMLEVQGIQPMVRSLVYFGKGCLLLMDILFHNISFMWEVREAVPESQSKQLRPPLGKFRKRIWSAQSANSGVVIHDLLSRLIDECALKLNYVCIGYPKLVIRTVGADNNFL
jgi:hypothetical protein